MKIIEIKQQLHQYIDRADERMAGALLAMFKNYFQQTEDTSLYTTDGKSISKAALIKEVMEAVDEVENGKYLTTEELRKQLKSD